MSNKDKIYIANGFIGIIQFILITSIAIYHFAIESTVFSKLVLFCLLSLLLGYFSFAVVKKDKTYKYRNHTFLNERSVSIILIVNLLISAGIIFI